MKKQQAVNKNLKSKIYNLKYQNPDLLLTIKTFKYGLFDIGADRYLIDVCANVCAGGWNE